MRLRRSRSVATVAVLIGLSFVDAGRAFAADPGKSGKAPPEKPVSKAAGQPSTKPTKFPSPVVDQLLKGWDGLTWGATLEEFKKKHPEAKAAAGGRWVTGRGETDLAGQPVTAEYGFSKKGQLALIRFEPAPAARKTFVAALVEAGVAREGPKPGWQSNGVALALAEAKGEQFAVALNTRFTDPPEKKPPAAAK